MSSRRNPANANNNQQPVENVNASGAGTTILDFMDEEDLGEHHMPGSALNNNNKTESSTSVPNKAVQH